MKIDNNNTDNHYDDDDDYIPIRIRRELETF